MVAGRPRFCEEVAAFLEEMRAVVLEHGYALAVHGSLERDLDLIAVPWVEGCSDADTLIDALESAPTLIATRRRVPKPHGRLGYVLYSRKWRDGEEHQPIDVSVMPPDFGATPSPYRPYFGATWGPVLL